MALGLAQDVWGKLYAALRALAEGAGGSFAFVVDEGNGLWCVGLKDTPPTIATGPQNEAADRFYLDEVIPRVSALRRGERFEIVKGDTASATASDADVVRPLTTDRYVAISFAAIYVVVVWFETPFPAALVRARIKRALPEIESLLVSMPPWGGPGTDAGAGKARA
jgi:hypothetical protein